MERLNFFRFISSEEDQLAVINHLFDLGVGLEVDKVRLCRAVTLVSELATNLIKYADEGRLELFFEKNGQGELILTVLSKDKGPGIENLDRAMSDNFSTKSSYGVGLPSVKRLSDDFFIDSGPQGTVIKARKCLGRADGQ